MYTCSYVVFVSLGCYNEVPQTGRLIHSGMLKSEIRMPARWALVRALFVVSDYQVLSVSDMYQVLSVSHMVREISGVLL